MAFTEKRLAGPTSITANTETTIYTCPTSATTTALIKQIIVTNTGGAATTFSISIVPYTNTAGTANRIFNNTNIGANDSVVLDVSQVLTSGDFISVKSAAGATINITVSGVENAGGMVVSGLADNAVTTAKIADNNVTGSKLGQNAFLSNGQAGAIILMEMM